MFFAVKKLIFLDQNGILFCSNKNIANFFNAKKLFHLSQNIYILKQKKSFFFFFAPKNCFWFESDFLECMFSYQWYLRQSKTDTMTLEFISGFKRFYQFKRKKYRFFLKKKSKSTLAHCLEVSRFYHSLPRHFSSYLQFAILTDTSSHIAKVIFEKST